jgi:hypothetical protein
VAFVPDDFDPPTSFEGDGFRLEPLGPGHNERDHEAWMSSIDHIRATPGFEDGDWPTPMSLEANLADLEGHARDFAERTGFTYSILDGDDVIGCLYIYPSKDDDHDASIASWVRASRAALDAPIRKSLAVWFAAAWPFRNPAYARD